MQFTPNVPCISFINDVYNKKAWRRNLGLVDLVVSRGAFLGPHTASLRKGTGVPWVVSRTTLWQSANPVRAVGASAVILSPLANVVKL